MKLPNEINFCYFLWFWLLELYGKRIFPIFYFPNLYVKIFTEFYLTETFSVSENCSFQLFGPKISNLHVLGLAIALIDNKLSVFSKCNQIFNFVSISRSSRHNIACINPAKFQKWFFLNLQNKNGRKLQFQGFLTQLNFKYFDYMIVFWIIDYRKSKQLERLGSIDLSTIVSVVRNLGET